METKFIRIRHGSLSYCIALYTGVPIDELSNLVISIFGISPEFKLVGLETIEGLILPISVASNYPEFLDAPEYHLLLSDSLNLIPSQPTLNNDVASDLIDLISDLAKENYISQENFQKLESLARHRNIESGIFSAYESFKLNNDFIQFKDAMMAIVATQDIVLNEKQKMFFFNIVQGLARNQKLAPQQTQYLLKLISSGNELIIAAHDAYSADQDEEELKDTIIRIAKLGTKSEKKISSLDITCSPPTLHTAAVFDVIHNMLENGLLSQSQVQLLEVLVSEENEYVEAAFEIFEADGNELELLDTLSRIVQLESIRRGSQDTTTLIDNNDEQEQEINQIEENHNYESLKRPYPVDKLVSITNKMMQNGYINENGMELLQVMIADQNHLVLAAFKAYEVDQDFDEIVDTLLRILSHFCKEEHRLPSSSNMNQCPQEFLRIIKKMENDGVISGQVRACLRQLFEAKDDLVLASWEVYTVERDEDDFVDTLLRTAKQYQKSNMLCAATNTWTITSSTTNSIGSRIGANLPKKGNLALSRVIEDMSQSRVLEKNDEIRLRQLLNSGNAVMLAAYEAYEADNDIEELIDTLKLVAKHASQTSVLTSMRKSIDILVEKKLLTKQQAAVLIRLVIQENSILLDAFSRHSLVEDAAGLAENLRHLLEHIISKKEDLLNANPQRELHSVVNLMLKEESITVEEYNSLTNYVNQSDDRIVGAYTVYASDNDLDELVDTLRRISRIGSPNDHIHFDKVPSKVALVQLEQVINVLASSNAISNVDSNDLKILVKNADPRVLAAFDVYEGTQDAMDLVDTVKRVASIYRKNKSSPSTNLATLTEFANGLDLPPCEAEALQRCIDKGDIIVQAAYEVYQLEQDDNDLSDTLRRIARHAVQQEKEETSDVRRSGILDNLKEAIEKNEDIDEETGRKMLEILLNNGTTVHSSLEIFGEDGDIDGLVDKLRQLALNELDNN